MKTVKIAFSPCPNDTFIFHAMLHKEIDTSVYKFQTYIHDVEKLNQVAFDEKYDITKLSFHAYLHLKNKYELLNAGSALGFGCGPILITNNNQKELKDMKIAIPGEYTTANMLLKLWNPDISNVFVTRFDKIIDGIRTNKFDAGLIIHESRFIFEQFKLKKIIDLGDWWEKETGLPIPLGCIAIKKKLKNKIDFEEINKIIQSSIKYAFKNKEASREYIKSLSQELDDKVIDQHIELYVNDFSINLGEEGKKAIRTLEEMASNRGII